MAFSNRLAAIVARLRQFDAEQAKLVIEYYQNAAPGKARAVALLHQLRWAHVTAGNHRCSVQSRSQENIQMLLGERIAQIDRQLGLIFKRARLARQALVALCCSAAPGSCGPVPATPISLPLPQEQRHVHHGMHLLHAHLHWRETHYRPPAELVRFD